MTTATTEYGPRVPPVEERSSGRSLGWWGMVSLIATEGMTFALLLFAYFFYRADAPNWPLGDIKEPELLRSGIRSAILLGSSIPMHIAQKGIEKGNQARLRWGLVAGIVMASLFLAGHVLEWLKIAKEFTPQTNVYGSLFYSITGLHAIHLTIGIGIASYIAVRAFLGRYSAEHMNGVEVGVMYWHFVDVVWAFVYSSLYLSVSLP